MLPAFWMYRWVHGYLWGLSGVTRPFVAQWVCQVFEPWAGRRGSWQPARQWDCSFYPSAASQSGCEAPCRQSQRTDSQRHSFVPTVCSLGGGNNYLKESVHQTANCFFVVVLNNLVSNLTVNQNNPRHRLNCCRKKIYILNHLKHFILTCWSSPSDLQIKGSKHRKCSLPVFSHKTVWTKPRSQAYLLRSSSIWKSRLCL